MTDKKRMCSGIDDDALPIGEQDEPDLEEIGKIRIWRDSGAGLLWIHTGHDLDLVNLSDLEWHCDEESPAEDSESQYLTLDEIRDQVWAKAPGNYCIVEVRLESALQGVIYQVGNYGDGLWYEHGTTRGYA